ncbi:MAG: formylglycine-generating enzyme family protein [Myxococcales bacterium]
MSAGCWASPSLWAPAMLGMCVACSKGTAEPTGAASSAAGSASLAPLSSWTSSEPEPRRGMAYISAGPLVAGSPPTSLPRRPDRELPGEQVMMKGFYIDKFAYPNEEGAIPLTNVTQAEAIRLCEKAGKRLCSELEWERACKGPSNHVHAWGDRYRADACQLGAMIQPRPSGMKVGCRSSYGVYDLHGGVYEWTSSTYRRGGSDGKVTLRGGNGIAGELVGRCANAESADPNARSHEIGFRCCAGPTNTAEVVIAGGRGEALERIERVDDGQFRRILGQSHSEELPDGALKKLRLHRAFVWRPINNEHLLVFTACSEGPMPLRCGLLVGRDLPGQPTALAWASTGFVLSSIHMDEHSDNLWLLGLDAQGRFKRLVRYQAGLVLVGAKERQIPTSRSKTKKKRTPR